MKFQRENAAPFKTVLQENLQKIITERAVREYWLPGNPSIFVDDRYTDTDGSGNVDRLGAACYVQTKNAGATLFAEGNERDTLAACVILFFSKQT